MGAESGVHPVASRARFHSWEPETSLKQTLGSECACVATQSGTLLHYDHNEAGICVCEIRKSCRILKSSHALGLLASDSLFVALLSKLFPFLFAWYFSELV